MKPQPHFVVYYDPDNNSYHVDIDTTTQKFPHGSLFTEELEWVQPSTEELDEIDMQAYMRLKLIFKNWNWSHSTEES